MIRLDLRSPLPVVSEGMLIASAFHMHATMAEDDI